MENFLSSIFKEKTIKRLTEKIVLTKEQQQKAAAWIEKIERGELKGETNQYLTFANIILDKILGYDIDKIIHNEDNVEYQYADTSGRKVLCIEAKGTDTKSLFDLQHRKNKAHKTPIDQTWDYMRTGDLDWGICTNYKYFALLKRNEKGKGYLFDFEDIKNNPEKLKEFVGIFSRKHLVDDKSTEIVYLESITEEIDFTKEFYKLFHETRLMLIKAFQDKKDISKEHAIYFAQIFLNRLIFIFFVEDRGYLSDSRLFSNRILKLLELQQSTEHSRKVYDEISELFVAFDKGSNQLGVFGFNGGLFSGVIPNKIYFSDLRDPAFFSDVRQHSKLLKTTKLNPFASRIIKKYQNQLNPIISNLLILDSFDFTDEVNVDVLGHIFEQSISDLEELKKEETSRKKKEGVYYTPEYVTDYICRNTIIPYLSKTNVSTTHELIEEYADNIEELENKFKEIKIVDPACGSGAFLIKAIDILLEIHKQIQQVKELSGKYSVGEQTQLTKWNEESEIRIIVENNIYGVDINRESVEITQLSLFLKLASNNRKLIGLSKNIKVGNSLITDKSLAEKAFLWEDEFPEILNPLIENKGFDIVLGNPPYVNIQTLSDDYKSGLKYYPCHSGKADLLYFFYNKGIDLLKQDGVLCFITSRYFLEATHAKNLRKYILEKCTLELLIDLSTVDVFKDIGIHTSILKLNKTNKEKNLFLWKRINDEANLNNEKLIKINQSTLTSEQWVLGELENVRIYEKIKSTKNSVMLSKIAEIEQGVKTGLNKAFQVTSETINSEKLEKKFIRKLAKNSDIHRYFIEEPNIHLIYTSDVFTPESNPNIVRHLENYKEDLLKRVETGKVTYPWYRLQRPRRQELFDASEKILVPYRSRKNKFAYDNGQKIGKTDVHIIVVQDDHFNTKYLLGILNSKLMNYL